ncbi:hypothetical protein BDA96_01G260000 [Sorghum bicolor]|uniref:Secreted protein n=2 Tax=Sorghum bicolor TaxID=4558 RepID=A0A921S164_SORBI|nr:hypothetical protein BDA96_01G260000 [Sorghum bicolor]KAG0549484.1 hypothetical protein BDA96_01G260000 [Sorghum bicolor]OQU83584.1 hypothetical protein SORBI_3005G139225 [Sorghum bicolor]
MVCICNLCGVCLVVTRQLLSNDTEQRHPCHDGRLHQSLLLHLPRSRCLDAFLPRNNQRPKCLAPARSLSRDL